MRTFQDLIDSGIAPPRYTFWGKSVPNRDPFVVEYNNTWGAASDTHMDVSKDFYFIGGSMVADYTNWDIFTKCKSWRCVDFKEPLIDWLDRYNMKATYDTLNGQPIYKLVKK